MKLLHQLQIHLYKIADVEFDKLIAHENELSKSLGGRSVFDDKPARVPVKRQLTLF